MRDFSNADIERLQEKVIDDYFWKYYFNQDCHLCSLCGNKGIIDTRETKAGRLNYCICPNGRVMREKKWNLA